MAPPSPPVIAIGPLPEPMTGQAKVTQEVVTALAAVSALRVIDNSPPSLERGPRYHLARVAACLRAVWAVATTRGAGAVYLSGDSGLGLIYGALITGAARARGRRVYFHHHSFAYIDRPSAPMRLLVRAGGASLAHVYLCETMRSRFRDRYRTPDEGLVVSNARHAPDPAPHPPRAAGGPLTVGLMAVLMAEKGVFAFIDAVMGAAREGLALRGVLAGPAPNQTLEREIAEAVAASGGRVEWRGPVAGAEKERFFRDIDVFLFPTTYPTEAQPMVVLEALAHGRPVIAYERGCIAGDLNEACGRAIARDDDFAKVAIARLREFAADGVALEHAGAAARARARALRDASESANQRLISELSAPVARKRRE